VSGILWHEKIGIITVSWDKFIKTWSAGSNVLLLLLLLPLLLPLPMPCAW
jgi:hypothetical protein